MNSDWISVEDRFPDYGEIVNLKTNDFYECKGFFDGCDWFGHIYGERIEDDFMDSYVTHWRKPPPPETK